MLKASRTEKEAGDLLGTYLLQGWTMTDEICKVESCSFPLMRSKDGSLSFCTYHDQLPNNGAAFNYKKSASLASPASAATVLTADVETQQDKPSKDVVEATVDNGEEELRIRRERREQSSKASQLIGQKMLQRWALLNEHCPNPSCYAVPLIRNPDTKQMFCVICENIILTEEEALALEKKKTLKQATTPEPNPTKPVHSPIVPQATEERKRQKIEAPAVSQINNNGTSSSSSDFYSSEIVVSTLSSKMNELTERVKSCHDPAELTQLFKAIKQCAGAIQACLAAGQAYDKSVSI
ncbi:sjogrens syndrome scleroderma autoantigen 1 family protein [Mucor ambiguus]|uniref:Sjogrens syndrome scleroderma autoantigen 1 family protein n=1 Tax=Mucor ambiguus TaxID=91626 RepID=A0A0C9LWP7_9FUNG|nr:sjogrens syndrome scleroderma autoantigen 1 family protein [Mucor ambiguus]